jgi:predicted RecB family nuclease
MLPWSRDMRVIASDLISHYRPSLCDLRVLLRHGGEEETVPSAFDEVLRRLGKRHERQHLNTFGTYTDLSRLPESERITMTTGAIAGGVAVLYQPAFRATHSVAGTEVEIVGMPDFLIRDGNGYLIRDSKMSRRIDEENHPEILLQLQLYGWLFEKTCGTLARGLQVHSGTGDIVEVPYDGGVAALAALERLAAIKRLNGETYEPVGWSKCDGCGFNARCWARAEADHDVALVPEIDQSLAKALHGIGVRSRNELLARFDATSLADLVDGSHERQSVNPPPFDPPAVEVGDFAFSLNALEVPFETVAIASPANPSYIHVPVVREPDLDVVSHRVSTVGCASASVHASGAGLRIVSRFS